MSQPDSFGQRLRRVRLSKHKPFDRSLSQDDAARLFDVSVSCYRSWEIGRHLPDARSREKIIELWPEVFAKEAKSPPV